MLESIALILYGQHTCVISLESKRFSEERNESRRINACRNPGVAETGRASRFSTRQFTCLYENLTGLDLYQSRICGHRNRERIMQIDLLASTHLKCVPAN